MKQNCRVGQDFPCAGRITRFAMSNKRMQRGENASGGVRYRTGQQGLDASAERRESVNAVSEAPAIPSWRANSPFLFHGDPADRGRSVED